MGLTKEERRANKEAKRLEKIRAEDEARKKDKKKELEREIVAQARKRDVLDKTWRQKMLEIKEPVFRQDIEVMWHTFERAYDKKDNLINYTMKLLDIADDQFQRTISSFCITIDTMINNFLVELEALSKENNQRTSKLLRNTEDEFAQIMSDHNAAETHIQLLLYHSHTTADSAAWATRGENLVREDEERIKYANERENLRSFLENNYNAMWDEYKAVLKAYILDIADNQKQVRKLRRKENLMSDIIASQTKQIANSDGMLKRLRTELLAYESGTKQAVFRDRRNRHRAACFRLKQTLTDGCDSDLKRLNRLVQSSDDTVEWLESAFKKGEKILRLAALCRKFETQKEKVLPFGCAMPYSPTETKVSVRDDQSDNALVLNEIATSSGLTRLWQKIAKADLTRKALLREKDLLVRENAMIVQKLQENQESSFYTEARKCACVTGKKKSKTHVVSVEGVFEVNKFL